MRVPKFKIRDLVKDKNTIVKSSNYALYGDMSRRVIHKLRHLTPKVKPYSIDEAFMEFHELITKELKSFGNEIKTTVKQWTRLPVSAVLLPPKLLQKIRM